MGNDGGSIPGRQDLVKERKKEKRIENNELIKQSQSKICALTKEELELPIVADKLGLLYNKEALIQALIEKRLPKSFIHITNLKDFKDLNIILENGKIICPITFMEFSGMNSFYVVWKCGCVISKKSVDELNMKDKCVNCGVEIIGDLKNNLVSLNYSPREKEEILNRITEEKNKIKNRKLILKNNGDNEQNIENKLINKKRNKCEKDDFLNLNKIKNNKKSKIEI